VSRQVSAAVCLLYAALVCTASAGATDTPVQADYLLAGSADSLWLIRAAPADETYDIVVRPVDEKWQWVTERVRGRPIASTVTGTSLHLILVKPISYLVYDLSGRPPTGRNPLDPRWPAETDKVALCPAGEMIEGTVSATAILAVVARQAQPATVPTESAAASPQTQTRPAAGTILAVFKKAGIEWEHVIDCPVQIPLAAISKIFATVADKSLYVFVAGDDVDRSAAFVLRDGRWREMPLAGWPEEARVIGLTSIANAPVFALLVPAGEATEQSPGQFNVTLARYDPPSESFALQPVCDMGEIVTWDAAAAPRTARFADGVAFVWQEGEAVKFARCGVNGELSPAVAIDVLTRSVEDLRGKHIMDVFAWVLLGIFVAMFLTRPAVVASQPFSLPETMKPGNPLKRVIAAFIDLIPWSAICLAVFRPEGLGAAPEDLLDYLRSFDDTQAMPTNLAYFIVSSSLLYVAYGTIMEYRFGATVGKMIFALRVVGQHGAKPSWRAALLRNLVKIIEMSWPVVVLPLTLMLFTRNRQRMGDFVARTAVIDKRFTGPPEPHQVPPVPDAGADSMDTDEAPQQHIDDGQDTA